MPTFFDMYSQKNILREYSSYLIYAVLGLLVELQEGYILTSNRESGYGRYDVILEPKKSNQDAYIMEFKVLNLRKEKTLEETLEAALLQIEEKQYEVELVTKGIKTEKIRKYGFAFEGKNVLIGEKKPE